MVLLLNLDYFNILLFELSKKLQRSLSRKGSLRLGDRKVNSSATLYEKDTICSPKGHIALPKITFLFILLFYSILDIVKSIFFINVD